MTTEAAVKERPMLFSGPMVRAIREGRKTQTRRVVKPQPPEGFGIMGCCYSGTGWASERPNGGCSCRPVRCPYGWPGDRIWVRETWALPSWGVDADGECWGVDDWTGPIPKSPPPSRRPSYAADWDWVGHSIEDRGFAWRPSIHMPRWASRILLEITDIRVERLQDISEADAEAEGCFFTDYGRRCFHQGFGDVATCPAPSDHHQQRDGWMWGPTTSHEQCLGSARFAYGNLWNSINGPGSWDLDPFVWAITFRVLEGGAA